MPRPKAHYSLLVRNHSIGKQLKVELIDLPFSEEARRFRLRVNGQWAHKVPVASKTVVLKRVEDRLPACFGRQASCLLLLERQAGSPSARTGKDACLPLRSHF